MFLSGLVRVTRIQVVLCCFLFFLFICKCTKIFVKLN